MTLGQVAEEIVARQMPSLQKVRILLAIVRALSAPPKVWPVENGGDVDKLLLTNPDGFEHLLRVYWRLLGVGKRAI